MNRTTAQAIVDELEDYSFFLADQLGNELYFQTNTGTVDDDYLDLAYDVAQQYEAVHVYPAYHQGEDMIVVEILN